MSCSSEMSPTISSRMSSSVTSPSTSPYSSTTSAKWVLRRRNALSCSDSGRMSGTNQGGSAIAMTSICDEVALGALQRAQQVLGVQDADDVLGLVAPQRDARELGLEHCVDDLFGRIVGVDRHHLGAMDHDIGHRQVAQIEQAAHHVAVVLLDAASRCSEIDRRRDLRAGQDRLSSPIADAEAGAGSSARSHSSSQHRTKHEERGVQRTRDHSATGRAR